MGSLYMLVSNYEKYEIYIIVGNLNLTFSSEFYCEAIIDVIYKDQKQ